MNYFLDTEFNEQGGERPTIELISIGLVDELGNEYYAESNAFNEDNCSSWVQKNVLPKLGPSDLRESRIDIRDGILDLIGDDPEPVFWAYYADYDWVVFCWIFGTMMSLPTHFPMLCMDLQQWWIQMGCPNIKPPDPTNEHDALTDAQWNQKLYEHLIEEQDKRLGRHI